MHLSKEIFASPAWIESGLRTFDVRCGDVVFRAVVDEETCDRYDRNCGVFQPTEMRLHRLPWLALPGVYIKLRNHPESVVDGVMRLTAQDFDLD